MRYVAAYLLAALSGNNNPSADDLKKIIGSVGIDCEADKITKIIGELKGKNIEELITKGQEKLASVPSGGPAAAAAPAGGAPAAAAAAPAKKEEKKKPEPESESDDDMGFGLFD
ncbi:large ribosomal subunit protein P2-like [Crassostrea virginica]|uniref:60S acidic ribosomal protein P2 n=1 Tax=Mucochytrium quahogii TaxID=96639 RepID=A0A7S2W9K7_9STRA|mmetsp:Transcript_24478/g.39769  ORF Transcript_24478/g.39769 Transcript_24478/m.39769 type:complete len:114 (+) Transcript_24478:54-395(+)|eukprot:CAMPEP_0203754856 /NCGR_PEP_ID=MMETSP0098-20131031/8414_1 /ASSEMBLY_ACC=CAM_ASM_000208 /TAXON_ID=96639 /ORGANISM=" , Strain NY0313808BC1" /LENGTH=113 /DNA_ID=CAMNT_0050646081 /DNA_START=54 /DNA_END=395 /DNA_ORIENTATION=-